MIDLRTAQVLINPPTPANASLVICEEGSLPDGDGIKVTLLPYHLLVEINLGSQVGSLAIPVSVILDGMIKLGKQVAH